MQSNFKAFCLHLLLFPKQASRDTDGSNKVREKSKHREGERKKKRMVFGFLET